MRNTITAVLVSILVSAMLLLAASCSQENIYLPDPDTWSAGGKTFNTFSEAIKSISDGTPRDVSQTDTIRLLRDIGSKERGESIIVPETYPADRDLCIDFGGHEYCFGNRDGGFFVFCGGDDIKVTGGRTVISSDAPTGPVVSAAVGFVSFSQHEISDGRAAAEFALIEQGAKVEILSGSMKGSAVIEGGSLAISGGSLESREISLRGAGTTAACLFVTGGSLDAMDIRLRSGALLSVSGDKSGLQVTDLFIGTETIADISGGTVEFSHGIEKQVGAEFLITGGKISNPHQIDGTVLQAIADGGHEEDVEHILIHDPVIHQGIPATCHNPGIETYWSCRLCDKLFSDEKCLHEIEEPVVIPQLEHIPNEEWTITDYSHYHICILCGDVLEEGQHVWSEVVDNKKHCLFCGFEIDMSKHTHWYPANPQKKDWHFSSGGHWLQCSCGQIKEVLEHTFGEWYFDPEDNLMLRDCQTCGYTEQQSEDPGHIIDVNFGTVIVPDHTRTYGRMETETYGAEHTVWFVPYGNTNPDYVLSCWYKVGVQKHFVAEGEDRCFRFTCDTPCTVYLQIASAGGTITKTAELRPR